MIFYFLLGGIIADVIIALFSILIFGYTLKSLIPFIIALVTITTGLIDAFLSIKIIRNLFSEQRYFGAYLKILKLIAVILIIFSNSSILLLIVIIIDFFVTSYEVIEEPDSGIFTILVDIIGLIIFYKLL